MAKKISSKDLFESEDIFKGIRDSAEKTLVSLNKINDEFKQTATTLKQSLGDAKFDSSDSIKKFTAATAEANKIQKQAIEIEKLKEQVRQQAIKSEKEQERLQQERIKTQKAEAIEKERLAKQSEKAAKANEAETGTLAKLQKANKDLRAERQQLNLETENGQQRLQEINAELNKNNQIIKENSDDLKKQTLNIGNYTSATDNLKNELRELTKRFSDLALQNQENTTEGKQLLRQITDLDSQLKKVDATVTDHKRTFGGYEEVASNLKTELRALTRELMNMSESDPKFQQMAQRAGELKDQIGDTQAIVKATAGSAVENLGGAMATVGQVGIAAFQGIESSMVLMGIENENILASMQKLQALAGLSDALSTLGAVGDKLKEASAGFQSFASKATTAFNGLTTAGKAFAVTGIGLVVTAIGYAVANWDKLSASISNQTITQKLSNQVNKEAVMSITSELSAADKLSRQLKDETLTRKEKIQKVKEFQAAYPGLLTNMNLETMSISQINSQLELNIALLKLQAKQKAIQTIREDEYKKQLIAQSGSVEDNLSWHMKLSKGIGDFIGLSKYTSGEFKKHANENIKSVTDESNTRINALDKLDKANELEMANLKKKGAVIVQGSKEIKDYSKGVAGFTGANDKLNESLERQKQILEDLNALKKEVFEAEMEYLISLETERKQEEIAVGEKYDNLILRAKANEIDITLLEEAKAKALLDIQTKYADIEIQKKKEKDAEILALEKETQDKLNAEYEKGLNDRFDAQLLMADDIGKERLNSEKEYQNDLDKLNELNINGSLKGQKEYDTALAQIEARRKKRTEEIDKKAGADEVKKQEERRKQIEAFADKTAAYFKRKSDEKIKAIDTEISAAENQAETLKQLAAEGNINAQQSLAEQQRIINEANLKKQKELKKQMRMEQGLALFKLLAAKSDEKNPLGAVIKDATGLLAFINSLPAFYDGTEDTGANGQGIDGKGGFHAVLHPNERVIPKSLNDQIGSMSNEQLTKLAQEYQNGRLITKSNANSSLDLAILANKLDTLTDVIKNKPETNIALGEITQSAMNIVESKRTGNTTIYNRFKVRK